MISTVAHACLGLGIQTKQGSQSPYRGQKVVKYRKLIQDLEGLNMEGSKTYAKSIYLHIFEAVKSLGIPKIWILRIQYTLFDLCYLI